MKNGRIEIGDYVKAEKDDPAHGSPEGGLIHGNIKKNKIYKVISISKCEPSSCIPDHYGCTAKQLMELEGIEGGEVWCWCKTDFKLVKPVKLKKVKKPRTRMEDLIL